MAETRISRAGVATARQAESNAEIVRSTLCWDDASMLCHFSMRAGSLEAGPGDGYLFAGQEPRGAHVLEDSEAFECCAPARPEYR
jgi:hypothetical protein